MTMDLKQTFVIKSFTDVMKVHSFLGQHHSEAVSDSKPLIVRVDQKEETRTKAQNRLIHMWFGEIAKHTGDTPEQMKFLMKKKFFASIMVRDDEESKEQYDSVIQFKKVIEQMSATEQKHYWVQYNNLVRMFVKDHLKTHTATTKQLSEFCDKIHDFALITLGLYLTCPDDLKYCLE